MTTDHRLLDFLRVRVGVVNRFPNAWLVLSDDGSLFSRRKVSQDVACRVRSGQCLVCADYGWRTRHLRWKHLATYLLL